MALPPLLLSGVLRVLVLIVLFVVGVDGGVNYSHRNESSHRGTIRQWQIDRLPALINVPQPQMSKRPEGIENVVRVRGSV
jgi:hypothetical protein